MSAVIDLQRRRAARVWLHAEHYYGRELDVVNAGEVILSLKLRKRPSDAAIAWLRRKTERGDRIKRDWAREILGEVLRKG